MTKQKTPFNREFFEQQAADTASDDMKKVVASKSRIFGVLGSKNVFKRLFDNGKLMYALVSDYVSGKYTAVPYFSVASCTVALLYLINPFDFIPDFIPFFGQIDDILILTACLLLVEKDLKRYAKWKAEIMRDTTSGDSSDEKDI
ncbi:MAG: YkvA family protein [Planctomycetota bacterium]|nr:YkvA family protein [Planctomycetota bacterium]